MTLSKVLLLAVLAAGLPARASLREALLKLSQACKDALATGPVERRADFKFSLKVVNDDRAVIVQSSNAGVPVAPRYRLDQLTRTLVTREASAAGVTNIVLKNFPGATRVELRSRLAAGDALSDLPLPALRAGRITVVAELSSDPEHVGDLARLGADLRMTGDGSKLKVKGADRFAVAMSGDARTGDFLFSGAGLTRALVILPDDAPHVLVFRDGEQIYGEFGWLGVDELRAHLKADFTDGKRTKTLKRFVATMPTGRELSGFDLMRIVDTMDWDQGRLAAIRLLRARMSMDERVRVLRPARKAMTFSDAKQKAENLLLN